MRLAFFINDIHHEDPNYTTTRLALEALHLGHEVFYLGVDDFSYDPDEHVRASALRPSKKTFRSPKLFLQDLQRPDAIHEQISMDDLDVLMLRSDPSLDANTRPWAQTVGILFGQLAARRGVIVLNDPTGLSQALNKLYFQFFPEEIRPKTLISRDPAKIRDFVTAQRGKVVVKPLQGSGGKDVFVVSKEDRANLNQIIEAISRSGYLVAQEYIPAAAKGDTRFFLMNGLPLMDKGKYAAFRRVSAGSDLRSNMHVGGKVQKAVVDDTILRLAEMVRPKLVQDGMFLVGLDVAGDKLMEINIFSPGGLHSAQKLENAHFVRVVIEALERKVQYATYYRRKLDNAAMAVL
jgi:glutathione synthase